VARRGEPCGCAQYYRCCTWLANAHAALDRAVWDAYGWPAAEVPGEVVEDVILARLLALNVERAGKSQTRAAMDGRSFHKACCGPYTARGASL
jgi:hypothetical protein